MKVEKEKYISELKNAFDDYAEISKESWSLIHSILRIQKVKKGELLLQVGETAKNIHFICVGALRTSFLDMDGNEYTKNIFFEKNFAASKVSLLLNAPSLCAIEALEESILINFNFDEYKKLISRNDDLKNFYIAYIEKNWIIEKEQREISLVMENATERYLKLLKKHPKLEDRIPLHYLASNLGITPTQLSRIRKTLK